jgi:DNA-binding transcriptional regulator of glucitol operon
LREEIKEMKRGEKKVKEGEREEGRMEGRKDETRLEQQESDRDMAVACDPELLFNDSLLHHKAVRKAINVTDTSQHV